MEIEMLKAISEMLDVKSSDKLESTHVKVCCAKVMLDGIIKGMEVSRKPVSTIPDYEPCNPLGKLKDIIPKKQVPTEPQPEIEFDNVKKIFTKVNNPPKDGMVEINGYRVKATAIVGKTLKDIETLGTKI